MHTYKGSSWEWDWTMIGTSNSIGTCVRGNTCVTCWFSFLGTRDLSALGHDHSLFLPYLLFLAFCSLIWLCLPWSPDCVVDIVVGFDMSTHQPGQLLFRDHPRLESYLPGILGDITSIRGVSCGAGAETHVNVAFKVNNDQAFPAKFQIYQETIFKNLQQVTINGPTHLNAQFLQSLWDTFKDKSASRGQVSMLQSIFHLSMLSYVSPSQSHISFHILLFSAFFFL